MVWLAYAGAFLALRWLGWRKPSYAVAATIFCVPFDLTHHFGPTTMTLPKAAIVGLGVGLLLRRASFSKLARREIALTGAAVLAVALTTALSITQADYPAEALRVTLRATEYVADFWLCALAFCEEPLLAPIALSIAAVAGVTSILALRQEFGGAPSAILFGTHVVPRIAGPLEGPNQLAGFLQVLLPPILTLGLGGMLRRWYIPLAVVVAAAEVLTFSRAGVATCAIGVAAALVAARMHDAKTWLLLAISALGIPVSVVLMVGGSLSRFWSAADPTQPTGLGSRGELWAAAWRLFRSHPWLGIGADNYEFELGRAGFPELRTHTNSQLLQSAVDGGLPLLAAFLWATLQPIVTLARNARLHPLFPGVFGALVGLALHQIFDDMTFFVKIGTIVWMLTGVALAMLVEVKRAAVR